MLQLDKKSLLVKVKPTMHLPELKSELSKEGLYFGFHPLEDSGETLLFYLKNRTPNLYHFKYGSLPDLVSTMTVALPSQQSFEIKNAPRSAIGPDFNRLIIGSQGKIGKIKNVTLKLAPLPDKISCAQVALTHEDEAQTLIASLIGQFIHPLFFKYFPFDQVPPSLKIDSKSSKSKKDILFLCFSGFDSLVQIEEDILDSYCRQHNYAIQWLELSKSHKIMNQDIFTSESLQEIKKQYRVYLWPDSDSNYQKQLEKDFLKELEC